MAAVVLQHVTVAFGSSPALAGIDLVVEAGECVALMGANGSGKSVLLRAVAGAVPLRAGRITVLGHAPGTVPAGHLAFLPQDPDAGLVGVTVADHFRLGCGGEHCGRWLEAARRMGLGPWWDRPVDVLSGGEKQRVAMAAWMVGDARVWLLDEPSAWLDPEGALKVRDAVAELRRDGATILWATHDPEDAGEADRVVVLAGGRIVCDGPPATVLADPRLAGWGIEPPFPVEVARTLRRHGRPAPLTASWEALGQWLRS
jgi:ABC-type multidrug transport system ATPase subunit